MSKLYKLDLEHIFDRGNKLWFDDEGNCYYGPDENTLVNAEAIELKSGYKVPKLFVTTIKAAFLLGKLSELESRPYPKDSEIYQGILDRNAMSYTTDAGAKTVAYIIHASTYTIRHTFDKITGKLLAAGAFSKHKSAFEKWKDYAE